MTPIELDPQEEDVAHMAVQALNLAQRRAMDSGRPVVIVVDDELVRIDSTGKTVLKKMPPRMKVSVRIKRASN